MPLAEQAGAASPVEFAPSEDELRQLRALSLELGLPALAEVDDNLVFNDDDERHGGYYRSQFGQWVRG